jgi:dihydrofolate reductase
MGRISTYLQVSLDGYFAGPKGEIAWFKNKPDPEFEEYTTLGSGSIVQQLTTLGLVDEYSLVVNPIVLGEGKNAFAGVEMEQLELSESRSFKNGLVWLTYQRV